MIPIIMCSFFALTLTIERLVYYLISGERLSASWLEQVRVAVTSGRWNEALALCQPSQGLLARLFGIREEPIPRVIRAGLAVAQQTPQLMEQAMEDAATDELPHVERHLRWLATIAQVATLLGLLGTVTGMVRAFQTIQQKATGGNPVSPADLAGGIWEALLTTVAGLIVAIPTIVAYNYLVNRAAEIRSFMERSATLLVGWVAHRASHAPSPKKSA
jgi:biopolymer transport protein ExbB